MAKYKITPLARFFLFMVILAPLLFLLATYVTGERKYLDQVIEWVQPSAAEEVAVPLKEKADSTSQVNKPASSQTADTPHMSKEHVTDATAMPAKDRALSLSDSLTLLKRQLKECKNN
jgi:hypothetical protein